MTNELIQDIAINYFSWSDELPTGGDELRISENSTNDSGEIDLSDDEALRLSSFILQEISEVKHEDDER
ncbi:hypothetical protein [Leuconostoc citreum]